MTLDRLAINQATTRLAWSHEASLEGYAKQGIKQVALWRDKVAETGVSATRALLDDLNMTVTGLNRIGPVFTEDGALDPGFLEDAIRGIEEAALLRADTLMFFPGTSLPENKDLGICARGGQRPSFTSSAGCASSGRAACDRAFAPDDRGGQVLPEHDETVQ